jgi:phage nucleotide-binding protein
MPKPPQIKPLGHDLSNWLRIMLHSEPGVGKTSVLATAPKALWLLADPNVQSAVLLGAKADRWDIEDWSDMDEALMYLRHEGYRDYEWVCFDSETHFQERGLDGIMDTLIQGDPARNQAGKPHRLKWAPDRAEYQQNMTRLAMWHRDLIRIPINIAVTAHTMRDEIELDDGQIENLWVPAIQGKNMPAKLCSYMNVVGFMYSRRAAGGIEVGMITDKDASHYAKDNWQRALGGHMINPTIPKIEAAIARKRAILAASPGAAKAPVKKAGVPAKAVAKKAVAPVKKTTR